MVYYRLYSFDADERHIIDVHHFSAATDALAMLTIMPDQVGIFRELWNQDRKVVDYMSKFKPLDPAVEVTPCNKLHRKALHEWAESITDTLTSYVPRNFALVDLLSLKSMRGTTDA